MQVSSDDIHAFCQDVKDVWKNYKPIQTEIEGIKFVAGCSNALAIALIWNMRESREMAISSRAIKGAVMGIASGFVRLAIPITISTSYVVYRTWNWMND